MKHLGASLTYLSLVFLLLSSCSGQASSSSGITSSHDDSSSSEQASTSEDSSSSSGVGEISLSLTNISQGSGSLSKVLTDSYCQLQIENEDSFYEFGEILLTYDSRTLFVNNGATPYGKEERLPYYYIELYTLSVIGVTEIRATVNKNVMASLSFDVFSYETSLEEYIFKEADVKEDRIMIFDDYASLKEASIDVEIDESLFEDNDLIYAEFLVEEGYSFIDFGKPRLVKKEFYLPLEIRKEEGAASKGYIFLGLYGKDKADSSFLRRDLYYGGTYS